jgi:hypothetical protein
MRKQSVTTAKRKIRHYIKTEDHDKLGKFLASWRGHASHADTCNLFNHLEFTYGIKCH